MAGHFCQPCGQEFEDVVAYKDHTCSVSGTTPKDPNHLVKTTTPNFLQISEAALERGAARAKKK